MIIMDENIDKVSTINEMVEVEITYESIDNAASEKKSKDVNGFLAKLFNVVQIGNDAKKIIDPNLDYSVKIPAKLLKKMGEHDVQFLKDKVTGEILPTLYDYTDKGYGGQIRLEIRGQVTEHDITNLRNSMNNLIEQARYDNMIEEIQKVHAVAQRIEKGQDNNRFALVNAGRQLLLNALSIKDDEQKKHDMIMAAIETLLMGCEQVQATLVSKMYELPVVPEKSLPRAWFVLKNADNRGNAKTKYADVQEYFSYYCRALKSLAYAYTIMGEPQMSENLLISTKNVFEHKNIERLTMMEPLLLEGDYTKMWYKNPEKNELKLIESYKDLDNGNDRIITVSGQQLLEVLDYGE